MDAESFGRQICGSCEGWGTPYFFA
jgi:hypothetical protein